jgi:hypothetical protein
MDCHLVPILAVHKDSFSKEIMFLVSPATIMTSSYRFLRCRHHLFLVVISVFRLFQNTSSVQGLLVDVGQLEGDLNKEIKVNYRT